MCFSNLKKLFFWLSIIYFYNFIFATSSLAIEFKEIKSNIIEKYYSNNFSKLNNGINFYGINILYNKNDEKVIINKGNNKEEIASNYSSVENIFDNLKLYENFPENNDLTLVLNYSTGGSCCNEYLFLTKTENSNYGNIINSGRAELKIVKIDGVVYTLVPLSDFPSSSLGAGFRPYPYRVLIFENGSLRYSKIGENRNVYEWLLKETKKDIVSNAKRRNEKKFDKIQKLIFPAIEAIFYQIMMNVDKKTIFYDLSKSFSNNIEQFYIVALKVAQDNTLPADTHQIFEKGSSKYINY